MSSKLERAMYTIRGFITEEETREALEVLWNKVQKQNKDNVIAHINVGHVEVETTNISDMIYCEDYEVLSGVRIDEDGNEFNTQEEYDERIKSLANKKFGKWLINPIFYDGEEFFDVFDNNGDFQDTFESDEGAKYFIQETKKDWIDEQIAFSDLEFETHEIYWNTVWRFNNYLDRDIADEVGLGCLEVLSGYNEGDEFLFLLGCGMDLSPKLMAYQALAHGYIDEKYLKHFRDVEYTRYVLGEEILRKVLKKLDIERFFQV